MLPTPYLDVSAKLKCCGEQGLLGMAFHPQFATNGYFYVKYTTAERNGNRVERYHAHPSSDVADAGSGFEIIDIPQPGGNHDSGMIEFAPDGKLWIATGDGATGGDLAQPLNSRLGKMLRIDVDAGSPYAIPPDNPFVGVVGAQQEIWARGLRNPWRFAIDAATSLVYIADVGESSWEEINVVPVSAAAVNYGWYVMEGKHCFNPSSCDPSGLQQPVVEYDHGVGCSITGGFVYRGTELKGLQGHYFYSDVCFGFLKSFRYSAGTATDHRTWNAGAVGNLQSFGYDGNRELYAVTGQGRVWRLKLRTN